MNQPERSYEDYIDDIIEAVEKAFSFVEGMTFDEFSDDDKTVFAVIRALEIIGEASKKIPSRMREQLADLPWKEMAGMRDKLIHDYFGVNIRVVRRTVQEELPRVYASLKKEDRYQEFNHRGLVSTLVWVP